MESSKSDGKLPIVSKETVEAFYAEAHTNQDDYGKRLEEYKNQLINEQPELCRHIQAELQKFPSEYQAIIFGSIVSTLLILKEQATADNLAKLIPKK